MNKKSIMAFSALQILFFHLWINVLPANGIEVFLRTTAYIGVDIFFFMSGFSLSNRSVDNYLQFELSRFKAVYVKFIIFAVIASIYSGWTFIKFIKVISAVDLFVKGGGAFLWFLPAIMIVYIIFPLFQKYDQIIRLKVSKKWENIVSAALVLCIWFVIGIVIGALTNYKAIFIFYNRIPVFLLGYYLAKSEMFVEWFCTDTKEKKLFRLLKGVVLICLGTGLIYQFAYRTKLQVPFTDFFYIMVIPASVGIVLLVSLIKGSKVTKMIGSSTLEMYAIQMIFGFKLANKIYKSSGDAIVTNIVVFAVIIVASIVTNLIISKIIDFICIKLSLLCCNVKKSMD